MGALLCMLRLGDLDIFGGIWILRGFRILQVVWCFVGRRWALRGICILRGFGVFVLCDEFGNAGDFVAGFGQGSGATQMVSA